MVSKWSPRMLNNAMMVPIATMTGPVELSIPRNTLPMPKNGEAAPFAMPPTFRPPFPNTDPVPAPIAFSRLPELLISFSTACFAFAGIFFTLCAHPKIGSDLISPGFARRSLMPASIEPPNPFAFPRSFAPPPFAFPIPEDRKLATPFTPVSIFGAAIMPPHAAATADATPATCGPFSDRYLNSASIFGMILSMPASAVSIRLSIFGIASDKKSFA